MNSHILSHVTWDSQLEYAASWLTNGYDCGGIQITSILNYKTLACDNHVWSSLFVICVMKVGLMQFCWYSHWKTLMRSATPLFECFLCLPVWSCDDCGCVEGFANRFIRMYTVCTQRFRFRRQSWKFVGPWLLVRSSDWSRNCSVSLSDTIQSVYQCKPFALLQILIETRVLQMQADM